jgi:hypothetical protein
VYVYSRDPVITGARSTRTRSCFRSPATFFVRWFGGGYSVVLFFVVSFLGRYQHCLNDFTDLYQKLLQEKAVEATTQKKKKKGGKKIII